MNTSLSECKVSFIIPQSLISFVAKRYKHKALSGYYLKERANSVLMGHGLEQSFIKKIAGETRPQYLLQKQKRNSNF